MRIGRLKMGAMGPSEADACRTIVVPGLLGAGWTDDQMSEQHCFTDGRIVVAGARERRTIEAVDEERRFRDEWGVESNSGVVSGG